VRKAFLRHPSCMAVSEDKVRQLMRFFVEKLGWTPEYVSACPTALSFS
jgi:mTERF domain-containing protein, mitochondrial